MNMVKIMDKDLSVIIPVYNCGSVIGNCIESVRNVVKNISKNYEIIVIDDGSIDDTVNIAKSYTDVRVISYYPNVGKGYAIKLGVMNAKGENIILIDGDMDINPALIRIYYDALNYSDLVIGSKYHPLSNVKISISRYILSKIFNIIVNITLGLKFDTQVGLKAGKADVFKNIFKKVVIKRYAFDVEMLTVATLLNYKITQMPVHLKIDKPFKINEIVRMLIDIIGILYRLRVTKWYQREQAQYQETVYNNI